MHRVKRTRGRNRNRITSESSPPSRAESRNWAMEFSMNRPWLKNTRNLKPPARRGSASSSVSAAWTRSQTSTTLAWASFCTSPKYAYVPSMRNSRLRTLLASITRPTSEIAMPAPMG